MSTKKIQNKLSKILEFILKTPNIFSKTFTNDECVLFNVKLYVIVMIKNVKIIL